MTDRQLNHFLQFGQHKIGDMDLSQTKTKDTKKTSQSLTIPDSSDVLKDGI
jgi:hypothetical protein